jgi:thiol-disulfide isomerase/thioredoxin
MATKSKSQPPTITLKPINRRTMIGAALIGFVSLALVMVWRLNIPSAASNTISSSSVNSIGAAATITLPTINGQTIALPGNSGQITVFYTMGYWCGNCVAGAKTLARLQPEYAKRGV